VHKGQPKSQSFCTYQSLSVIDLLITTHHNEFHLDEIRSYASVKNCTRRIDLFMENKHSSKQTEVEIRKYVENVFEKVKQRNPHESEFHQSVKVLFDSLIAILVKHPTYIENGILE